MSQNEGVTCPCPGCVMGRRFAKTIGEKLHAINLSNAETISCMAKTAAIIVGPIVEKDGPDMLALFIQAVAFHVQETTKADIKIIAGVLSPDSPTPGNRPFGHTVGEA